MYILVQNSNTYFLIQVLDPHQSVNNYRNLTEEEEGTLHN